MLAGRAAESEAQMVGWGLRSCLLADCSKFLLRRRETFGRRLWRAVPVAEWYSQCRSRWQGFYNEKGDSGPETLVKRYILNARIVYTWRLANGEKEHNDDVTYVILSAVNSNVSEPWPRQVTLQIDVPRTRLCGRQRCRSSIINGWHVTMRREGLLAGDLSTAKSIGACDAAVGLQNRWTWLPLGDKSVVNVVCNVDRALSLYSTNIVQQTNVAAHPHITETCVCWTLVNNAVSMALLLKTLV